MCFSCLQRLGVFTWPFSNISNVLEFAGQVVRREVETDIVEVVEEVDVDEKLVGAILVFPVVAGANIVRPQGVELFVEHFGVRVVKKVNEQEFHRRQVGDRVLVVNEPGSLGQDLVDEVCPRLVPSAGLPKGDDAVYSDSLC